METVDDKDLERFWKKVAYTHPLKCWWWTATQNHEGYGNFHHKGKNKAAHRFSFFITYGYYPEVVRHKCDNPRCVNPFHLQAGTQKENCQDTVARGRHHNQNKNKCSEGHLYDETNTYFYTDGRRDCRLCRKERNKDYKQKIRVDL